MITLRNEETGFVITLDDSSEEGFAVSATDALKEELQSEPVMIKEMIEQRKRVLQAYTEDANQTASEPTIERQIADRLLAQGYTIITEREVDNDDNEGDANIVF